MSSGEWIIIGVFVFFVLLALIGGANVDWSDYDEF